MQLKASKLLISDTPIKQQQFNTLVPVQQLIQSESTQKFDIHEMRIPLIAILFAYDGGTQFEGFQLQLQVELMIKGEKISQKSLAYKRTSNHLYKLIQIDSCICYQKPISAIVTIKYAQNQQCQEIQSVEELCLQLGKRAFVIYNQKVLSHFKRDLIIKQPINTLYRYSQEGYVWMKCTNSRLFKIRITKISMINWLINSNQTLKLFESTSTLDAHMEIKKDESIGVMLTLPKHLHKIQVPYLVQFYYCQCPQYAFKMIKYLYIN